MPLAIDGDLQAAANIWVQYFPYRASLIRRNSAVDDYGGDAPSTSTSIATNVPTFYESLRQPISRAVGSREEVVGTHLFYFLADTITPNITTQYEIHINAYLNEPAKVFVDPIILEGAFSHIVQVVATQQT